MVMQSFYFVIQAFARKLIARGRMKSRKQMTKGLLLITMHVGEENMLN